LKLATKTMLSFIAVIVFQAGLTISVLSYFVHKQNEEIVMDEMKKEASVVLDNYMAWKTQLWKNLITLKSSQVLADYTKRLYRETSEERMKTLLVDVVNNTKELLITSGIDFVVIKTDKQLVIRSISNSQLMFSNLFLKLDQKSLPYPYLENMVLDGNLTLTGIINLGTDLTFNMNIYLIKVIDQQFVNKLSKHRQAKLFFYIKDRYLQAEINEIRVGTVIPFERLSYAYNVLTNLTFDEVPFSGIVQRVGKYPYSLGNENVFLATMMPSERFSPNVILVYKLVFTVFILGSLLAFVLSWFLSINITRPVKNLLSAMTRVKEGKFDIQLGGRYSSEIQGLFSGFNEMAGNLNLQQQTTDRYFHEITSLKDYNERIINSISTGIITINKEFVVEKVNRGFLETFNLKESDLMGYDIRQVSLTVLDGEILDNMKAIIENSKRFHLSTKRLPPRTVFEIKLYHITTSHSMPGCVLLLNNISKKLELDERILQAEKLSSISMLSAGVAHEINNPLSSIMSNVQYLLEEETNPEKSAALNWIRQETRRIGDIVKRLLDFAASHLPGETDTNVNEEIRQVVDLIRFSVKQKIVIEHQLDDSIPRTKINQTEFKQVIINLLTNSVQACHDSGAILIRTSAAADKKSIRISIADTGEGMPGEIIPRIFDPFFTTKPTGIGTGLGLSVVYGIVKNHQGEIRVESSPGKGSTFIITIPAMEDKR
jgi:nitrogen-specific signal transduction histidine kinase/HAMP domain-containing protein